MTPTIIDEVVLQHAEEAAFQWILRDAAVGAPHYDLKDLAELDDKVEAHLDGLRVAGEAGWGVCEQELGWDEPGEVFAASVMAFESGDQERIERVLEAGASDTELSGGVISGVISGVGWLTFDRAKRHIKALIESDDPAHQRIGIAAASVHRQAGRVDSDPDRWVKPNTLLNAIQHPDPLLAARAMRAAGELGRSDLAVTIASRLDDEHEARRFWAAWSCAVLGYPGPGVGANPGAGAVLQAFAVGDPDGVYTERAADLAARRMPLGEAIAWHKELTATSGLSRVAMKVAGAIGDPGLIDGLFEVMEDQDAADLHRLAGEAFSMITGIDLAYDDLERDEPAGYEAGPTEDEDDEDVAMDPDEDLPWPDPRLIRDWWSKNRNRFTANNRYLCGQAITESSLWETLRVGYQRLRVAAALELALLDPKRGLIETRARGDRQLDVLGV